MSTDVLSTPLQFLKGVGPRKAADLKRAGLITVEDLLYRLPFRYEDRSHMQPIATLRTRRSGVRLDSVAEVTVDEVDVLDHGHAAGGFVELEVELTGGDESDLARLGKRLRRAGATTSDGTPKVFRVVAPPEAPTPSRKSPLGEQLRHLLQAQLQRIERHDPGVRLGDSADDVHRCRVATRRTRALVRATRPLLGEHFAELGHELRWLAGVLGPVRDLDVLIERLGGELARLDEDAAGGAELLSALTVERSRARATLVEALESERYQSLLALFAEEVAAMPEVDTKGDARTIARDELRTLHKHGAGLSEVPSDDELHELRIRAKRARYAAELSALAGTASAPRLVDALKRLQDVIGSHQDAVVAEERLRGLAQARTAIAVGRLVERERERKRAARAAYPAAYARI